MLDIKQVLGEKKRVQENLKKRGLSFDWESFEDVFNQRSSLLQKLQSAQERSNALARSIKTVKEAQDRNKLILEGKDLKKKIQLLKEEVSLVQEAFDEKFLQLPNWIHPDVPVGGEDAFNICSKHLAPPQFDFSPKDHLELSKMHDLVDFDRGSEVTRSKFYFLKNEAVWLEQALILYALKMACEEGFTPFSSPDLAKTKILEGTGYSPKGPESQIYRIEGHDLNLIGTAEITLGGYWSDQILSNKQLPICMVGHSHCFRTEAGSHGSHSKGLYRVHQFSKVELFVICRPEDSQKYHSKLLSLEEKLFKGLGLPYRVIDVASGDLGAPASRKFDIEAWMPGRGEKGSYGEVTSTSNCLDYQARRLKIRYRDNGEVNFVHTLNGTAFAVPRVILALLENGQQVDGSIRIPECLKPYLPFDQIAPKGC